jgi:hypothetical protein
METPFKGEHESTDLNVFYKEQKTYHLAKEESG